MRGGADYAGTSDDGGELDLARMRRERRAKLQSGMADQGIGALLLTGGAGTQYAAGAAVMPADSGRAHHEATVVLLVAGDDAPHVFTHYPDGVPPELPADHVHEPASLESEAGVQDLARRVRELLDDPAIRLGVDELTAPAFFRLDGLLPETELTDAGQLLSSCRIVKTRDEVECIRRAQHINEIAMYDVRAALRPGVRQSELTGIFLRRIFELGATGNVLDPIWQTMPGRAVDGAYMVNGDLVFPTPGADQILRRGDVVWCDSGISYHGYLSDFGRTWTVGAEPRPAQHEKFHRWREVVDRVLASVRPGVTGAELTRVAKKDEPRTPWPSYFYLIHGVGLQSAEMPLIGTDLGESFDESLTLAAGMVLVLEPMIWEDDGTGGYRAEEIAVVTEDGYRMLSDHPYDPYE